MIGTIEDQEIYQFLSRHPELKALELAVDLERPIIEIEDSLNRLREQGRAVEIYCSENGYVWSAIDA